jgi:CMP-N-acetylneuraminic acid synthetase
MKRLAIIPARSGSKRIPLKNIKLFCGEPMLSYPIRSAEKAEIFDIIHVSTDSVEIFDVAANYGRAPDFIRPGHLSGDHVSMMEATKYVVETYEAMGYQFDIVALLYATSPLMDASDLRNACITFEKSDRKKAILSVAPFPSPIEQGFRMAIDSDLYPVNVEALATRTQDLQQAYYDAGMFAIFSPEHIKLSVDAGDFSSFRGFRVSPTRVTDIDWPEDWDHAELLYRALQL